MDGWIDGWMGGWVDGNAWMGRIVDVKACTLGGVHDG